MALRPKRVGYLVRYRFSLGGVNPEGFAVVIEDGLDAVLILEAEDGEVFS